MLEPIVAVLAPVFALIALGFLAVRTGYVAVTDVQALGRFVVAIVLPALIFGAVAGAPLAETVSVGFLLAYGTASLAVFAFGVWRARRSGAALGPSAMQGMGMSLSNSGFMGYPLGVLVLGEDAARVLALCMMVENLLILPLALILGEAGRQARRGFWPTLRGVAAELTRSPIFVALALGLGVAASGFPVPAPVLGWVWMIAGVAAPVALFVVGGTVAAMQAGAPLRPVVRVVAGKLVLHPLAVAAMLVVVPEIDPLLVAGAVLFASVPMLSIYPILGRRYGAEGIAATAMVAAVITSAATIAGAMFALKATGLITLP